MKPRSYRRLQMHRIAFTDLPQAQMGQLLRPAEAGPGGLQGSSAVMAGKRCKILYGLADMGLEYNFRTARELEVRQHSGAWVKTAYGAIECRGLVLVSHVLPGTQRSIHLVVDLQAGLVTVFEVEFSKYAEQETQAAAAANRAPQFKNGQRHREAQPYMWHGYIDQGKGAPAKLHTPTNRLEGKGIAWQHDDGSESLEFYLSTMYSNYIDLTRGGGEMTVCAPSQYVMINDHQFIYSRVDAEFTGTFTLQVIDLFDMSRHGVRLGIDEKDALDYVLCSAKGELIGQIASFEAFGNNSEEPAKRRVYRPLETFELMSDAQVRDQVLNHAHAFGEGQGSGAAGMGGYKSELVTRFKGKQLSVRMDNGGPAIDYDFVSDRQLKWRYAGDANWREAWYEMYEPDEQLYFFAHLLDAEFPRSCAMVAFDTKNGLATVVKGTTGSAFRNNETSVAYHFGTFSADGSPTPPTYLRHAWTDEMVGECVTWNYQRGNPGLTSMHFYATPSSYSWIIFQPDGSGGMQWSSPGWYSKLRDGVYIMAWIEEACNGTLGVICFNQRTMHDAGFGYHVGSNGLSLSVIGARARHAGRFNIKPYIGLKA